MLSPQQSEVVEVQAQPGQPATFKIATQGPANLWGEWPPCCAVTLPVTFSCPLAKRQHACMCSHRAGLNALTFRRSPVLNAYEALAAAAMLRASGHPPVSVDTVLTDTGVEHTFQLA